MEDKQQWLSIAAVVLVIGGLGFFLYQRSKQPAPDSTALGEGIQIEERAAELLDQMNIQIPEKADTAGLRDVADTDATGVATRIAEEGLFTSSFIASLPDLEKGHFYAGWLVREDPYDLIYAGKLNRAKGGWLLDFSTQADLSDHKQVVITLEETDDQQPEKHILEGRFN